MIEGFEHITRDLTPQELKVIREIAVHLRVKFGKQNAVTSKRICDGMNDKYPSLKLTGPRLRRIINHIRVKGMIRNLVASSHGYYVENNIKEIRKYIQSLRERANAINDVADSFSPSVTQTNINYGTTYR